MGKTKYLFLPSIVNMPTPRQSETGFYCPLIQANQYMVRMALGLERSAIINPVIHLKHDQPTLSVELAEQLSAKLGRGRGEIRKALEHGMERQARFNGELLRRGRGRLGGE